MKWKQFLKPDWRKIVIFVLIFLTFTSIFYFLPKPFVPLSDTMSPAINKFDMVFWEKVSPEQIKVGDIVAFDASGFNYPIIHRVVEVNDKGIITKGDNNPSSDESRFGVIPFDKIIGKTTFVVPSFLSLLFPENIITTLIYSYLLSCIIIWMYDKFRKRK
jgi:signal peptidase I